MFQEKAQIRPFEYKKNVKPNENIPNQFQVIINKYREDQNIFKHIIEDALFHANKNTKMYKVSVSNIQHQQGVFNPNEWQQGTLERKLMLSDSLTRSKVICDLRLFSGETVQTTDNNNSIYIFPNKTSEEINAYLEQFPIVTFEPIVPIVKDLLVFFQSVEKEPTPLLLIFGNNFKDESQKINILEGHITKLQNKLIRLGLNSDDFTLSLSSSHNIYLEINNCDPSIKLSLIEQIITLPFFLKAELSGEYTFF